MKKKETTKEKSRTVSLWDDSFYESAKETVEWWEGEFKKNKKVTPLQKDLKRWDVLKSERAKILLKGSLLCFAMAQDMPDLIIDSIANNETVLSVSEQCWRLGMEEVEKVGESELVNGIMSYKI